MLKQGKIRIKLIAAFIIIQIFGIWHMIHKIVDQRLLCLIGKITLRITPFTIILIITSVTFTANEAVIM